VQRTKSNKKKARTPKSVRRLKRKRRLSAQTHRLITRLHSVIKRNVAKWDEKYPGVIVGYHVAKKIKKGKAQQRYAVVFHVEKKIADDELSSSQRLPRHVTINIAGRGKIRVPTDVIATGRPTLVAEEVSSFLPGAKISEAGSGAVGTMGPLVAQNEEIYILGNMHVLGHSHLSGGRRSVTIPRQQQSVNIVARGNNADIPLACFERGIFNESIDAAIARVPDAASVQPFVPGFGNPRGFRTLTPSEVHTGGYAVAMVGGVSRANGKIVDTSAIFEVESPVGLIKIFNLLPITPPIAQRGDSGATIIDAQKNVIGIVVGTDRSFSYAVPIETILLTFGVQLV